ncbi:MAG: MAPEG family protein [Xanthomonadales bacterium]|nr:MAPEG family protein [Xanthomonadales bacterium]
MIQLVPVTGIYAGLLAILIIGLAGRVVGLRRSRRVGFGDGEDRALAQAIRVHANAIENVPLALLLLLLLELNGAAPLLLHVLGSSLVVSRLLHAWGLTQTRGTSFGRFYGTLVSWLVTLGAALCNIYIVLV